MCSREILPFVLAYKKKRKRQQVGDDHLTMVFSMQSTFQGDLLDVTLQWKSEYTKIESNLGKNMFLFI